MLCYMNCFSCDRAMDFLLLDVQLSFYKLKTDCTFMYADPTAGPSATDPTTWCLDDNALHENIKKTLSKFCIPSPMVLR